MTKVTVSKDNADTDKAGYRAVTARNQAVGRTAGEALDALASQLPTEDTGTLIIVRRPRPGSLLHRRATRAPRRAYGEVAIITRRGKDTF